MCKKLKYYNDLKDMLDKYDTYTDFQYIAVINLWYSLQLREKLKFLEYYKQFLNKLKEIKEKYYKAQKSLYSSIQQAERFYCRDECTCKKSNLSDLNSSVELELFLKVCRKIHKMNSEIYDDFNSLCNNFMCAVCKSKIDRLLTIIR